MNKGFYLAEDNRIYIYYTDIDSLYIKEKDEKKIKKLHEKKYNCNMKRTLLNQFHIDFSQVWVKYVFVGGKCYCNLLDDGTSHNRVKCICQDFIEKKTKEFGGVIKIYEAVYHEKEIEFHLYDSETFSIDTKNLIVILHSSFVGQISFSKKVTPVKDSEVGYTHFLHKQPPQSKMAHISQNQNFIIHF
jgi:hypothetical protein